jgi:hypothetical protein
LFRVKLEISIFLVALIGKFDFRGITPNTVKNWRDAEPLEFFQPPGSNRVIYPRQSVIEFPRQNTKRAKVIEFKRPAEIKRTNLKSSPD